MELDIFEHQYPKKYSTKIINTWGGAIEISLDDTQYEECKKNPFKIKEIILEHLIYMLHSFSINTIKDINDKEYYKQLINSLSLKEVIKND